MKNTKKLLPSVVASALMAGSAQAAISGDTVKLGYLADMSGTYRDLAGPNGLTAMEMAVADFGGKVNNARIEVVSADDRNSPDVASSTVRRWVENDGVDMVGGLTHERPSFWTPTTAPADRGASKCMYTCIFRPNA